MEKAEQEHQEARKKAEKEEKAKAKTDGDAVKEGPEEPKHDDDHGIKEPEKEPTKKVKRVAEPEPGSDDNDVPLLDRETSGLAHLRRRRLVDAI